MRNNNWGEMCRALEAFKATEGHCCVPAVWKHNPSLGRWVAMQRYRHKIGELQKDHADRLSQLGFAWAPGEGVWHQMYERLVRYKAKHDDCAVPSSYPTDQQLATWVRIQRRRMKIGVLSADRTAKLNEVGFAWTAQKKVPAPKAAKPPKAPRPVTMITPEPIPEEHLYQVTGTYIQHNGTTPLPAKLARYVELHGELPPSIVLPCRPHVFTMGSRDSKLSTMRKIRWSGKGPLPAEVSEYLNENGVLPAHN